MESSHESKFVDSSSEEDSVENGNGSYYDIEKTDVEMTEKETAVSNSEMNDDARVETAKNGDFSRNLGENVKAELKPHVGMIFSSEENAYKFYNAYARRKGFSVRKGQVARRVDGSIRLRVFLCSKEGIRQKSSSSTRRYRAMERTNCMARIRFRVNRDKTCVVTNFISEHNHDFAAPHESHYLRSQRKVLRTQAAIIVEMHKIEITQGEAYDCLPSQAHAEDVGSLSSDHTNFLRTQRTRELEPGGAQVLLNFLKAKQFEDPSFFYAIQIDVKGQLTNFFWADTQAIVDYNYFGDVVSFDTTYRINRYALPFAPFLGINHHKQTIVFGTGLLLDETIESFVWLFETFRLAMSGRQPQMILTDQIPEISKAISISLPDSCHRFCLWHILQSASKHLAHVYNSAPSFQSEFKNCIYEAGFEEDFHNGWNKLIERYALAGIPWIDKLYKDRDKWALVYDRDLFCATMTTTQWSELMNDHFKKHFNKMMTITTFIKKYAKTLNRFREKEAYENFKTKQTKPVLLIDTPMLHKAADTYTRKVYRDFEEEYKSQLAYHCELISVNETMHVYKVSHPEKHSYGLVEFDSSQILITCSCKKFEAMGILCMHALKVLNNNNIFHLPPQYVLKRWTRYAKHGITSNTHLVSNSTAEESLAIRYNQACHKAVAVAAKSASSTDVLEIFEQGIEKLSVEVENALHSASMIAPKEIDYSQESNVLE